MNLWESGRAVRRRIGSSVLVIFIVTGCSGEGPVGADGGPGRRGAAGKPQAAYPRAFAGLSLWDDGLSEMSYYDAVDALYAEPRHYTRVMLLNREWLNPRQRVKAERPTTQAADGGGQADIPVFKLNIIEEIPTPNYNYRYMVTVFLNRDSFRPEKLAATSQEWCGTTFKQLQWLADGLRVRGFSYFEGEADRVWTLPADPVAYPKEGVFLLARAAVASGQGLDLHLLPPMRSTHLVAPAAQPAKLTIASEPRSVRVPFGRFEGRTVVLSDAGGSELARYVVEAVPPYRLLSHMSGDLKLSLRFVERRAYWDRSKPSRFYRRGAAP